VSALPESFILSGSVTKWLTVANRILSIQFNTFAFLIASHFILQLSAIIHPLDTQSS
jgi:hypothetical protein